MSTKKLAKRDPKSTALETYDYGQDAGVGFENQAPEELSIPFVGIIQTNSPQLLEDDERYIPGAKPGMLFNSSSNELLGKELLFTPAVRQRAVVEWIPREQGGGFVNRYEVTDPVVLEAQQIHGKMGKMSHPESGNDLVATTYLFGVTDECQMLVLSFTSTKLRVWRRLNTAISKFQIQTPDGRRVTPPMFAHRLRIKTVKESNSKGTFFNFAIEPAVRPDDPSQSAVRASLLPPTDERYIAAKALKEQVESGTAVVSKAAEPTEDSDDTLA